ncbi:hypothetical protein [Streptomyces sp. NBC_01022]|uniref:hypothetical protein n=1 Tax=Streptomyces sp. NBC_01022 TaxID=2903723 RepID=UPI002DDAF8FF|nr:hypothetical protein [Streptomyces sp. NBC_01022]WRZ83522.1 hypothetical protein OG316_26360 [Streptomyces sp. NBC_01022]
MLQLLADEAHRFLVQVDAARRIAPFHEGVGVLRMAFPVQRVAGREQAEGPEHLVGALPPGVVVRTGAVGQRRPQSEARDRLEVAVGGRQYEALAEAVDGVVDAVGVARDLETASERQEDPGAFGRARRNLAGKGAQQGDRVVEFSRVTEFPGGPQVPEGALEQQVGERGGVEHPSDEVVGRYALRPPAGLGDGLLQVFRAARRRVPGVQYLGEGQVRLSTHGMPGRCGVEGVAGGFVGVAQGAGVIGAHGVPGQQQGEVAEVHGVLEGVGGRVRGRAAGGDALLVHLGTGSAAALHGPLEEGDAQVGEERGPAGQHDVRLRKGGAQQCDALGAQRRIVQGQGGAAQCGAEDGAVLGAVRVVPGGELHRLAQFGDRLPHPVLVRVRLGPVPEDVPQVAVPAGLFVADARCADHGGAVCADGVGECLEAGAVLEAVEEDESEVRQTGALLKASLAEDGGGVPQQGFGDGQASGVAALLEEQRQPDGGVVREAGLRRGAGRIAGQRGEQRAQSVRHVLRVLLVHRDEPEQSGGERPRIGFVPRDVAAPVGVGESQGPEAPHVPVGQDETAAHLVGRRGGLRPEEPLQGGGLGVRAFGLLEDAFRGVLRRHAGNRRPRRTLAAGAVPTSHRVVFPCCFIAPPSADNRINLPIAAAT